MKRLPLSTDDHCAVVKIRHALAVLLSFLHHLHSHVFAGKNNWFEGIRQLIDVEHLNGMDFGYLVQVEIVGYYWSNRFLWP